jgi:TetR/AcrR family transcriptional repressor of nem operon
MTGIMPDQRIPAPQPRSGRKAQTRVRILEAAAKLFREHGIDGTGVDAVMHAAGLTHGGFYAHFPSKEALAAEVCAYDLARSAARWAEYSQSEAPQAALARIAANYLKPENVARGDGGCVLPVLGSELARRRGSSQELTAIVADMAATLQICLGGASRGEALAALATMVGAVTLARLSSDPELAEAVLKAARESVTASRAS